MRNVFRELTVSISHIEVAMEKFFFFLVSFCMAMAAASRLSKRQQSCDVNELPEICREIVNITIEGAAFSDQEGFLSTYCGSTCAGPLYNYFRNCDIDPLTATRFDYYCSSNAGGEKCLRFSANEMTLEDSSYHICTNVTLPVSECESALEAAYERAGCCVYSQFVIWLGRAEADSHFGDVPKSLCTGGASNEILYFPAPPPVIIPECEVFAENVTESCRHLLVRDVAYSLPFTGLLEEACGDECGPQAYRYYTECDKIMGGKNATTLNVYCSVNNVGDRCGDVLIQFSGLNMSSCQGTTCTPECADELRMIQGKAGCCFSPLLQVLAGIEPETTSLLAFSCGIDIIKSCEGHFSPNEENPYDANCTILRNAIPGECQAVATSHSPFQTLIHAAYSNASRFETMFCQSNCAKPTYDFLSQCSESDTDAAFVDFLCSKSASGKGCASIFSDKALESVITGVCESATDSDCSDECKNTINEFNKIYDCCLFSYTALIHNYTFVDGLWRECGLNNPGLCTGGISSEVIFASGAPEQDPTPNVTTTPDTTTSTTTPGGRDAAAISIIFNPLLILVFALLGFI